MKRERAYCKNCGTKREKSRMMKMKVPIINKEIYLCTDCHYKVLRTEEHRRKLGL